MSRRASLEPAAAILSALLLVTGCGGNRAEPAVSTRPCAVDDDCDAGELCSFGGVQEIHPEPDDEGTCAPAAEVVGHTPASWLFRGGGRALADRLCTAQGLWPGDSEGAAAVRERQKELLAQAGTRMIRLDLTWSRIEPEQGLFDFSAFDPMIDAARSLGLEVIGILAYGVPWATDATGDDDKFPPDDPDDYAAYAAAVAQHYAGKITHYELWNEPNGGYRFFRPELHGDATRYAELLAAGAAAVRDNCEDCRVHSAGLFYHTQTINGAVEFLHDMLSHRPGALDGVDFLGFHPYPRYPPSAAPEDDRGPERALGGMVGDLQAVLALHGVAPLAMSATELGWPSFAQVTEADQARYLARTMLLGASLGIDALCWFNVVDGPMFGQFPPEDDFGLYRYGSEDPGKPIEAKPARDALSWLAQVGAGAVPAGPGDGELHDPAVGRFALDFDTPGGRITAVWQVDGSREITLPGETRSAFDLYGKPVAQPVGGTLAFEVGPGPTYLLP